MSTNISLIHLLSRNKSNIKTFLKKNNLNTYEEVLAYCDQRKITPMTIDEYKCAAEVIPEKVTTPIKLEEKDDQEKPVKQKRTRRKASTTQRKTRARSNSKKVKDS